MLKWSELMNHCRITYWDVSRKCSFIIIINIITIILYCFFLRLHVYMCPGVAMCIV